jgi:CHAT domain-containing protein
LGSKVLFSQIKDSPENDLANLQRRITALTAAAAMAQGKDEREFVSRNLEEAEKSLSESVNSARREKPERASLMSVQPLTLQQVQSLLEPEQVVLQYFVAGEKTYLWAVTKQEVRAFEMPFSQTEVASRVQSLRAAISELQPLKEVQKIARELYSELIAPARVFIRNKEVIVVPHDVLHYLPFQALYSPEGRYLVEEHSISYLSSASLMQFTKAKRKPMGQKVLAVGNPAFEPSRVALPMSELEAGEIRRLYPQSAILARAEATEETVKALAGNHDVLHFATHAELNKDDPLASAVLLAKGAKDDGRLEVREIFNMDLKAALVVLSACETGLGALSSGDELVGLTRAFIYAGTPSVVASLWKVDDRSTAHLMSSFYRNLKTKTKVESLRQAQLDLIRGKTNSGLLAQRGVGGIGKLGPTPATRSLSAITTSHP